MANPQKPWKAEYAKSGRSSCKTCKSPIDKETFRLGKMVQATQFDGFMPMWHHAGCILKKPRQIKSTDDVEGIDALRWEDQQKIRECVESAAQPKSNTIKDMEYGIEVSQTSRATCKHCGQKIIKGEVRVSSKPDGAKGLAWHHAKCLLELSPSVKVKKLPGWDGLSPSDQSSVNAIAKKLHSGADIEAQDVKDARCESTSKAGTKRRNDASGNPKSKIAKAEGDASNRESRLEAQTKELWTLKDDMKKHVTTAELRLMLELNSQDSTGSELDLRDRW